MRIKGKNRPLATYVCGNPGTGKSSLLQRMILSDIRANHAVCVIDPTAQLIKTIVGYIPQEHLDRTVYFSTSMPVPLDFFSYRDEDEKDELISDISNIIDLSTAPIAKQYLRKIIQAIFEANANPHIRRSYTLFDIPKIVLSGEFRETLLSYCAPERAYDFPPILKLQADSVTAIVMRMSRITDSKMMQAILGSRKAQLRISDMISGNKIFLVDLKETENDAMVGSIIAAKIQHAIFARRELENLYAVAPYYLYIDECDVILKFAEERFAAILGRARKFKLCMTLANPIPSDLPPEIERGLGKIGNLVIFNLDAQDARSFKAKLGRDRTGTWNVDYLPDTPPFHAFLRTGDLVRYVGTHPYLPVRRNGNADYVRERTLRDYGADACNSDPIPHTSGNEKPEPPKRRSASAAR